jgi:hypothetical protein
MLATRLVFCTLSRRPSPVAKKRSRALSLNDRITLECKAIAYNCQVIPYNRSVGYPASSRSGYRNGMKKSNARISNGARIAVIGLVLIVLPAASASAMQPPYRGCVAISKGEYQGAKKKKMLRTRFGTYVRTGRLWRRYYWYCR